MRFLLKGTLIVCLTLSAPFAVGALQAQKITALALGCNSIITSPDRDLAYEQERAKQLTEKGTQLAERSAKKEVIIWDLIEERISFHTAAVQLHAMSNSRDIEIAFFSLNFSGATKEEKFCQLVIFWTDAYLRNQPERAVQVRQRLEADMRTMFSQRDGITFHVR